MIRRCQVCAKKFEAKASRKYCSDRCAKEGVKMRERMRDTQEVRYLKGNLNKIKKIAALASSQGISYGKYMAKQRKE